MHSLFFFGNLIKRVLSLEKRWLLKEFIETFRLCDFYRILNQPIYRSWNYWRLFELKLQIYRRNYSNDSKVWRVDEYVNFFFSIWILKRFQKTYLRYKMIYSIRFLVFHWTKIYIPVEKFSFWQNYFIICSHMKLFIFAAKKLSRKL